MRLLLALNLMVASMAQATDWNLVLKNQLKSYWPKSSHVSVSVLSVPAGLPSHAKVRLTNTDAVVGLVPVEWEWVARGRATKLYGTANVQVRTPVAVAAGPLTHGQALDPERVKFVEHEIGPIFHTGFFTESSELHRRKVRGYVAPGAVLNARNTTSPMLVEAGQTVTLAQIQGALQLTARMESLESGARGEWVRVSHPKTRKVLRARVTGPGQVELN